MPKWFKPQNTENGPSSIANCREDKLCIQTEHIWAADDRQYSALIRMGFDHAYVALASLTPPPLIVIRHRSMYIDGAIRTLVSASLDIRSCLHVRAVPVHMNYSFLRAGDGTKAHKAPIPTRSETIMGCNTHVPYFWANVPVTKGKMALQEIKCNVHERWESVKDTCELMSAKKLDLWSAHCDLRSRWSNSCHQTNSASV